MKYYKHYALKAIRRFDGSWATWMYSRWVVERNTDMITSFVKTYWEEISEKEARKLIVKWRME